MSVYGEDHGNGVILAQTLIGGVLPFTVSLHEGTARAETITTDIFAYRTPDTIFCSNFRSHRNRKNS
jgi:hypothetical protein